MPTVLAARGIAAPKSRWQSRSHAYLFSVLSHGFSRKRETARSLHMYLKREVIKQNGDIHISPQFGQTESINTPSLFQAFS